MKTAHTSTTAIVASLLLSQANAKPLIPVFSRQVSQTAEIISELVKLFGTTADFAMKMFPSGKEAWYVVGMAAFAFKSTYRFQEL